MYGELIYLVDLSRYDALGYVGHDGVNNKYVVLFDAEKFIQKTNFKGIDSEKENLIEIDNYGEVKKRETDKTMETFFHELFHVAHFLMLGEQEGSSIYKKIDEFQKEYWLDATHPKEYMSPNEDTFLYLKRSGFISEYGATNILEDVATTVAAYYMFTRYHSELTSYWSDGDSKNDPRVLIYSEKDILQKSSIHKVRACKMANLILEEKCKI